MKKKIIIDGMSCAHCSTRVANSLNEIDGVESTTVQLENKCAIVELSKNVENQILTDAILDTGFDVISVENC